MTTRRRNSGDVPFSLLSFQDAITGVIGVVLLIAIILCLQLVSQPADATVVAEPVQDDPAGEIKKNNVARARFESQAHDYQGQIEDIQKAIGNIQTLPPSGITAPPSIKDLESAIVGMKAAIRQKGDVIKDLARAAAEIASDTHAADRMAREMDEQAREDLERANDAPPHLTVVRGQQDKEPILIELTGTQIVIGRLNPDGTTTANSRHPAARLSEAAEDALQALDPEKHTLVVFVHPDASDHLNEIRELAKQWGLTIGWDLAPERPVFTADR